MNFEHIQKEFQEIMGASNEERLAFLNQPRWINYPLANRILETLRGLMEFPARPRMPNLLLVGDSNNGKTTIIRRFFEMHGQGYVDAQNQVFKPVILAEAPPSANEKALYVSILERFWTPYRASDSVAKLRYQVVHLFRECHVKLLLIDEFHSLLTGPPVKQREAMNALKLLCNELAIPIVGIGTHEAVRVLHTDPQHASRFDVLKLSLWPLDKEFQRLLASFERVLPLRQASHLSRPEIATALHAVSGGNLGDLQRLLVACATDAIVTGKEQIDKALIEKNAWVKPTRGIRELVFT